MLAVMDQLEATQETPSTAVDTADNVQQRDIRSRYRAAIEGLIALKPKRRHPTFTWAVLAGVAYVIIALVADGSIRSSIKSWAMNEPSMIAVAPDYHSARSRRPSFAMQSPAPSVAVPPVLSLPQPEASPSAAVAVAQPQQTTASRAPQAKPRHTKSTKPAAARRTKR